MIKITLDILIGYNKQICNQSGTESIVINKDNLLSALGVQYSYFDSELQTIAAVFRSLIIGHGFADGNKRTATLYLFAVSDPSASDTDIERIAIDIATGRLRSVKDIVVELFGPQKEIYREVIQRS